MRFYTNVQLFGNTFLVRGYENGKRFESRESEYRPTLFLPDPAKKFKYKTLEGECVAPIKPGFVRDCREHYERYKDIENFKTYGNDRYVSQYISDKYPEDEIKFDMSKIKLVTLDIEVKSENGFPDPEASAEEILLISIQDYNTKEIITWGVNPFVNKQKNVNYIECGTEQILLSRFIDYWTNNTPDVVTGWNVKLYDIPYLTGRLVKVLGEKEMRKLSPWRKNTENFYHIMGQKKLYYDVAGVSQLDYLDLYKKFTYTNQESYRLDHIAKVELGQQKLDHS